MDQIAPEVVKSLTQGEGTKNLFDIYGTVYN